MPIKIIAETERLILRHLCESDIDALGEMLADPEVMRFSVNGVMSRGATKVFLEECLTLYSTRGFGSWAVESQASSAFIGFAGLTPESRNGREEISVGYRLARRYWKQGFATEATAMVLDYGFRTLGLDCVSCTVVPDNFDSIKVAEKIGFASYDVAETHGMSVRVYRMTLNEWMRHHATP